MKQRALCASYRAAAERKMLLSRPAAGGGAVA